MPTLSDYNREKFSTRVFESRESRLRKAHEMLASEFVPGRTLLDIAAGSGITATAMQERGWQVSAVDISPSLVDQMRAAGIDDAVVHEIGSAPLPHADESFDAVFAGEIIEHLVDTKAFLIDIHRVLKPGGVAVVTTPNLASFENRARLLLGIYPKWAEYELGDQGHVRLYTKRTLKKHLRENGFDVLQMRGNWVPIVPQILFNDLHWPPISRTGDWFPGLSSGLIVSARKR